MKTVNKIAFILISIALISSCDKRKDYMVQYNKAPEFGIKKKGLGGSYNNSLVDSIWLPGLTYSFDYRILDERKDVQNITLRNVIGTGSIAVNKDERYCTVNNCSFGKNQYDVICTDKFGASTNAYLELYGLNNRVPDANLFVIQTNLNSQREIKVSGVNTIDPDVIYGDFISEYRYKIGNSYNSVTTYTVNSPLSSINYIAASTGTVMVYLQVKDSKGSLSSVDSVKFNIQ